MKRYDEIQSMSVEKLATYLCEHTKECEYCIATDRCWGGHTGFTYWLGEDDEDDND